MVWTKRCIQENTETTEYESIKAAFKCFSLYIQVILQIYYNKKGTR